MSSIPCQVCKKNAATVHITEIASAWTGGAPTAPDVTQRHVCAKCANMMQIPTMPVLASKGLGGIMSLLKSAQRGQGGVEVACPKCGMSLAEFRAKGRLGCPHDYELFREQLDPLLLRMHNASQHVGRLPGLDEAELSHRQRVHELREKLDLAVREEEYEAAARLRDELAGLEAPKA